MGISVALTINNVCNMACPHCYLNLASPQKYIDEKTLMRLFDSSFMAGVAEVVVVGKEPLANVRSIELVERLVEGLDARIKISIITNGIGLPNLPARTATKLNEICLSLDGGPQTYATFRGEATIGRRFTWDDIIKSVATLPEGAKLTILHTVSVETCDVDDMMNVGALSPSKILFSPFVKTSDVTDQNLPALAMRDMFTRFSESSSFRANKLAHLVLGTHSCQGLSREELREMVRYADLLGKVRWLGDSGRYVRVSHDGHLLNSGDALDMKAYQSAAKVVDFCSLAQFLERR